MGIGNVPNGGGISVFVYICLLSCDPFGPWDSKIKSHIRDWLACIDPVIGRTPSLSGTLNVLNRTVNKIERIDRTVSPGPAGTKPRPDSDSPRKSAPDGKFSWETIFFGMKKTLVSASIFEIAIERLSCGADRDQIMEARTVTHASPYKAFSHEALLCSTF